MQHRSGREGKEEEKRKRMESGGEEQRMRNREKRGRERERESRVEKSSGCRLAMLWKAVTSPFPHPPWFDSGDFW